MLYILGQTYNCSDINEMEHRYIEQVFNLTIENSKGGIYLLEGDIDTTKDSATNKN